MSSRPRRYYTPADLALLWSFSGGFCCFPDCDVICVEEATDIEPSTKIGVIGHIEAASDGGPRPNSSLTQQQRNAYPNLILLCPNHHTLVDARDSTYTVDTLRTWKATQEATNRAALAQAMAEITFHELDDITQTLISDGTFSSDGMNLVPLREKMDRNGLTDQTHQLFTIGLMQSKEVEHFVESMTSFNSRFIGRLTSGFVDEYHRQRAAGYEGDSLLAAMQRFSARGRTQIRYQSAGLAVLVYLFERCEVFER